MKVHKASVAGASQAALDLTPTPSLTDNCLRKPLSELFARVPAGWRPVTDAFLASPAGRELVGYIDHRVQEGARVYPATVFRALELTPPEAVRVVSSIASDASAAM